MRSLPTPTATGGRRPGENSTFEQITTRHRHLLGHHQGSGRGHPSTGTPKKWGAPNFLGGDVLCLLAGGRDRRVAGSELGAQASGSNPTCDSRPPAGRDRPMEQPVQPGGGSAVEECGEAREPLAWGTSRCEDVMIGSLRVVVRPGNRHRPGRTGIRLPKLSNEVREQNRGKNRPSRQPPKGPTIGGIDQLNRRITWLFKPRREKWDRQFEWRGALLVGKSAVGRTTVVVLAMNHADAIGTRQSLIKRGAFPAEFVIEVIRALAHFVSMGSRLSTAPFLFVWVSCGSRSGRKQKRKRS